MAKALVTESVFLAYLKHSLFRNKKVLHLTFKVQSCHLTAKRSFEIEYDSQEHV